MPSGDYRTAIEDYIRREAKPHEKFGHQPRLYELAKSIAADLDYDDEVLHAAAWLHDIGVFTGHRPEDLDLLKSWDNTAYAVEKTSGLLTSFGFPDGKIAAVSEAIRTHQPHGTPQTIEGEVLRDADILEQLGTIAVLRTVCKVGRDTRFVTFSDAIQNLERALLELPSQLRLASAKKLAEPKIEALRSFLASVQIEAGGHLG